MCCPKNLEFLLLSRKFLWVDLIFILFMSFLNEPVIKAYAHLISIMRFFLLACHEKDINSYCHFTAVELGNRHTTGLGPPCRSLSESKSFTKLKSMALTYYFFPNKTPPIFVGECMWEENSTPKGREQAEMWRQQVLSVRSRAVEPHGAKGRWDGSAGLAGAAQTSLCYRLAVRTTSVSNSPTLPIRPKSTCTPRIKSRPTDTKMVSRIVRV